VARASGVDLFNVRPAAGNAVEGVSGQVESPRALGSRTWRLYKWLCTVHCTTNGSASRQHLG
jgi:hypothetical protein